MNQANEPEAKKKRLDKAVDPNEIDAIAGAAERRLP